jgi:hypothetical protein
VNTMRPVIVVKRLGALALLGSSLSTKPVAAQSDTAPPKAAEARPKHNDWLFENGPAPKNPSVAREALSPHARETEKAPSPSPAAPPPPAPVIPTVQAVPPGPPQKNLTGEEFKLIHTGSTVKEVLAVLGPPSSRVVVPDDDGHLRETLQYWVKGSPMGTVRLDDGRVVQIETGQK